MLRPCRPAWAAAQAATEPTAASRQAALQDPPASAAIRGAYPRLAKLTLALALPQASGAPLAPWQRAVELARVPAQPALRKRRGRRSRPAPRALHEQGRSPPWEDRLCRPDWLSVRQVAMRALERKLRAEPAPRAPSVRTGAAAWVRLHSGEPVPMPAARRWSGATRHREQPPHRLAGRLPSAAAAMAPVARRPAPTPVQVLAKRLLALAEPLPVVSADCRQ